MALGSVAEATCLGMLFIRSMNSPGTPVASLVMLGVGRRQAFVGAPPQKKGIRRAASVLIAGDADGR